ncbi:hypothetical protein BDM02DRAFT_3123093 [Thelephora ganbajun]|uniref:Uncharacterized protein n=1 Tax=Thelephora ganbajun TaxID=370292 RepID=A0ACB6Z267_THEGA|nr:hypothetical protein BDM02DRAFT_3123093 [Thelephora ganbajun]
MPTFIRSGPLHIPKFDSQHTSSREANAHTIQNLEAKIRSHGQEIIRLKRLRNSLLNISVCLAPEILGYIFWWGVVSGVGPGGRIAGGTFNFIFVCRYWFDVATSTPSLWAFWGTSLRECVAFHRYSGSIPLYLNLVDPNSSRDIREASSVLQDWGVQRRIRHLHIHTSPRALTSILSFMSAPQPSSARSQIRSLTLMVEGPWIAERPEELPDITNFLNTRSLPELQSLRLRGCNLRWESLILQTSKLTRLFVHAHDKSRKPTVLQLAALFARNSALEEIDLSLEIASISEDSLPDPSISILLPHLRNLTVHGNAAGHTQLLNLLMFSNELKHVSTDLFLDGFVTDVAAALTPFLPNLFLTSRPSNLTVHVVYALVGLSINVSRSGEQGDAEDFLMLRISSLDMNFWGVAPTLPEEVAKRLPTANIKSLGIRRYSDVFRQDFRRLFQTVSAVQELRVTDSAINDIVQVLASPSPTEEGEHTLLPHLHTFRLKDINFASDSHAGMVAHLGHLLEQRYNDGLPLSKLSMAYCPHISWDACSRFVGYLNDHLCWDRYEAVGDRHRVCETCHTRWSDSD